MLNEVAIREHLKALSCSFNPALYLLESTSSTNDYFKGKPKSENNQLEFCFTEEQTQGRGRLGRTWHSPVGVNIMMSCRWAIPENVSDLNGLSSCVSLSLVNALKKLSSVEELACKWPNDLYYQNKKLAGILIELHTENGRISEAIIGIGLNVNMLSSELIDQPWTSLQNILNEPQDRHVIAALVIQSLHAYLVRFSEKGFEDFQQEWQAYDYLTGRQVTLCRGQEKISGIAKGINLSGHLLIETIDGLVIPCFSGEILRF
jgi:BirA family transcriptional regulator, biotin operon repressor / biotin---[acetyl-CoA-carboxylase] ligase